MTSVEREQAYNFVPQELKLFAHLDIIFYQVVGNVGKF